MSSVTDSDPSSLAGLLGSSLTDLLNASSRKHKPLRDAAQLVLDELAAASQSRSQAALNDADRFFLPLKLACETKVAKLMELALDCMQKLIAYGYLRGSSSIDRTMYPLDTAAKGDAPDGASASAGAGAGASPAAARSTNRKLIDMIIETIYECSTFQDDGVQLQVRRWCCSVRICFFHARRPSCAIAPAIQNVNRSSTRQASKFSAHTLITRVFICSPSSLYGTRSVVIGIHVPGDQSTAHRHHRRHVRGSRAQSDAGRARVLSYSPLVAQPHQSHHGQGHADPNAQHCLSKHGGRDARARANRRTHAKGNGEAPEHTKHSMCETGECGGIDSRGGRSVRDIGLCRCLQCFLLVLLIVRFLFVRPVQC